MAGKGKTEKSREDRSDRMVAKKAAEAEKASLETPVTPAGTLIKVKFNNTAAEAALLYLEDNSGIERYMLRLETGKSTEQSCKSPAKWTVKVGGKVLNVVANQDGANFQIGSAEVKAI